jgi:hypothetical protein
MRPAGSCDAPLDRWRGGATDYIRASPPTPCRRGPVSGPRRLHRQLFLSHISSMTMKSSELRRFRHELGWTKRPRTLRCRWCKTRMKVAPCGRLPIFCCQTCRQRDYERRKWSRPHAVELLAKDLATVRVRGILWREIGAVLQQLGITDKPPPLPQPPRKRPALRLVKDVPRD